MKVQELQKLIQEDLGGVIVPSIPPVAADDVFYVIGEKSGALLYSKPTTSESEASYSGVTGQTSYAGGGTSWSPPMSYHHPAMIDGQLSVAGSGIAWPDRWMPDYIGRKPEYEEVSALVRNEKEIRDEFGFTLSRHWRGKSHWLGLEIKGEKNRLTYVKWDGEWVSKVSEIGKVTCVLDEITLRMELIEALYSYHSGNASDSQCEFLEAHEEGVARLAGAIGDDAEKSFLKSAGMSV